MDINGFMFRVKEAMLAMEPDQAKTLYNVKYITIDAMRDAFKPRSSWDDLKNPMSDFVKFLNKECKYDDPDDFI